MTPQILSKPSHAPHAKPSAKPGKLRVVASAQFAPPATNTAAHKHGHVVMVRTGRGDCRISRMEAESLAGELWAAAQLARKAEVRGEQREQADGRGG